MVHQHQIWCKLLYIAIKDAYSCIYLLLQTCQLYSKQPSRSNPPAWLKDTLKAMAILVAQGIAVSLLLDSEMFFETSIWTSTIHHTTCGVTYCNILINKYIHNIYFWNLLLGDFVTAKLSPSCTKTCFSLVVLPNSDVANSSCSYLHRSTNNTAKNRNEN